MGIGIAVGSAMFALAFPFSVAAKEELSLPVHQISLVVNGIPNLESVKLDEIAQKGFTEFAFIMQPIKIEGATGSAVFPVAIR